MNQFLIIFAWNSISDINSYIFISNERNEVMKRGSQFIKDLNIYKIYFIKI